MGKETIEVSVACRGIPSSISPHRYGCSHRMAHKQVAWLLLSCSPFPVGHSAAAHGSVGPCPGLCCVCSLRAKEILSLLTFPGRFMIPSSFWLQPGAAGIFQRDVLRLHATSRLNRMRSPILVCYWRGLLPPQKRSIFPVRLSNSSADLRSLPRNNGLFPHS